MREEGGQNQSKGPADWGVGTLPCIVRSTLHFAVTLCCSELGTAAGVLRCFARPGLHFPTVRGGVPLLTAFAWASEMTANQV